MKLASALALLSFLTIVYHCNASCWTVPREAGGNTYSPCFFEGELIPRGSTSTKNCQKCYCDALGYLRCCSTGSKLKQLPNDCKKVVSPDGCYEYAVQIQDESTPCMYGVSMVGR